MSRIRASPSARSLQTAKVRSCRDFPPFTGGLVGYFSYDYIKYAEPTLRLDSTENADFQDVDLMLFDKLIVFDAYKQKLILIAGVRTDDLEASYERAGCEIQEMVSLLKSGARAVFNPLHLETKLTPAHKTAPSIPSRSPVPVREEKQRTKTGSWKKSSSQMRKRSPNITCSSTSDAMTSDASARSAP